MAPGNEVAVQTMRRYRMVKESEEVLAWMHPPTEKRLWCSVLQVQVSI